jgi:MFS family permease
MTSTAPAQYSTTQPRQNLPFIIGASSVGTLIEWYDFYLYGVLALFFSKHFFAPAMDPNLAFILSLFVFWTGFLVRPFGAIVFGHLGDLIGRKFTFMLTLLLMGAATFVVGLLPGYGTIGILAPILLVAMRVLQGLALGGEYGGAATYIAEHSPDGGAASIPLGSRPPPRWASSWHCWSSWSAVSALAIRRLATGPGACRS